MFWAPQQRMTALSVRTKGIQRGGTQYNRGPPWLGPKRPAIHGLFTELYRLYFNIRWNWGRLFAGLNCCLQCACERWIQGLNWKTTVGATQSPLHGPHNFTWTEGHFSWEGVADKGYVYSWNCDTATKFVGVGELLPCMDTRLCVSWQRPTMSNSTWHGSKTLVELDFWSGRTFWCIEDRYHLHSCLGLSDYSRPFHLHAGEAIGVAMVDPRAWWQTDGPWYA